MEEAKRMSVLNAKETLGGGLLLQMSATPASAKTHSFSASTRSGPRIIILPLQVDSADFITTELK